ncbi:MAG: hypothetical protein H7039_19315 [Bryobacteraceae bacterium]|nr:hypothetical protein [Bryobacteraceae bacterium]
MGIRLTLLGLTILGAVHAAVPTAEEIIQMSCERESQSLELRRQYTYRQTDDIRQLDKKGGLKSSKSKTFEVLYIDGTEYRRLVEKDGKPLTDKEIAEEQAKLNREIAKHKRETEGDRRKRQGKDQKELEEERRMRSEVPKAFDFQLLGEEPINGRPCWKLQAEPKPGYKPTFNNAKFLPKFRGTVWIDKENYEWGKVDAESLDTITAGLGLFRVGKGFRLVLEQMYVNNEIWAPVSVQIKANARAMLFVGGNFDVRISFKDYKKYSVSSTVTVASSDESH